MATNEEILEGFCNKWTGFITNKKGTLELMQLAREDQVDKDADVYNKDLVEKDKQIKELLELIKALEPYVYEEDKYLRLQIEKARKMGEEDILDFGAKQRYIDKLAKKVAEKDKRIKELEILLTRSIPYLRLGKQGLYDEHKVDFLITDIEKALKEAKKDD